jgi:hypothetical protein
MVWQTIIQFVRDLCGWSALSQRQAEMALLLESAKQSAIAQDWFAAIQDANLMLEQSAPRSGFKRWLWNRHIRPLQQEVHQHFDYWESQAEAAYDRVLAQSRWLAVIGKFADAIVILEPIHQQFFRLEGKQHLETLMQLLKDRKPLYLALLAEQDGQWETAIDFYDRLLTVIPEIATEIRFRQAIISVKTAKWDDATQRLKAIANADWNNLRATTLLEYVEAKRLAQPSTTMPSAPSVNLAKPHVTSITAHKQAAIAAWEAKNWGVCAENLAPVWLIEGGYTAFHRWSVAAYYAALEQPDRQSLETCLISQNMALANLAEYSQHPPEAQQELVRRLKQQMYDLIQAIEDRQLAQYLTNCNAIDELAMQELQKASCPALRWKSLTITPMIYRKYPAIAKPLPTLPESYLGALYTGWADAILLWQQGNGIAAKKQYPAITNPSPADRYAKRYVAYYEGCDYLTLKPGGYPRWREAQSCLWLAQPEIRASERWQNQLNQLFETHYSGLWEAADRRDLTQFWVDLLDTAAAHYYFQQAHDT